MLKVGEQCLGRREGIRTLLLAVVPVIALPDFVVVTNDADAIDYVGQAVLEVVTRSLDGRRQPPQDQFCE